MLTLERPFRRHADIGGLLLRQLRQLGADLVQMQPGHLLIEMLGQRVDLLVVLGEDVSVVSQN